LLKEVQSINKLALERFIKRIRDNLWVLQEKRIAVWGLTFKPHTDDVRNSVAIDLVTALVDEGAHVVAYDPKGAEHVKHLEIGSKITIASSPLDAVNGAEALVIATEWPEFAEVDFKEVKKRMVAPMIFDGRNLLDPMTMKELGLIYHGIGRGQL
jgi:UDPglucose 6-dehydrogenase